MLLSPEVKSLDPSICSLTLSFVILLVICSYAPKSHPELAKSAEELIVSFASNTLSLDPLIDNLNIYTPQFFRVTISK